jgi:hypothetical protein
VIGYRKDGDPASAGVRYAASGCRKIPCSTDARIATVVRTRRPFPSRSASTHRPSSDWMVIDIEPGEFLPAQGTANQHVQEDVNPLAP